MAGGVRLGGSPLGEPFSVVTHEQIQNGTALSQVMV